MAYLKSGIDGGRASNSLVRNRVVDIRGDLATGGKLLLTTTEPTVVDGNELGRIDFQAPLDTGGTDAILVAASIYAEADDTFASDNNATELVFATGASETAAEKMRITSDGKVGIGTATPVTDLTVEGPITIKEQAAADADTAGYGQLWVDDAANSPLFFTNDAGNDIGITTGSTLNAASLGGVLPSGVTGGSGLTALGTIAAGVWEATDIGVAHGGTGASTAAAAASALGVGTEDSPTFTGITVGLAALGLVKVLRQAITVSTPVGGWATLIDTAPFSDGLFIHESTYSGGTGHGWGYVHKGYSNNLTNHVNYSSYTNFRISGTNLQVYNGVSWAGGALPFSGSIWQIINET